MGTIITLGESLDAETAAQLRKLLGSGFRDWTVEETRVVTFDALNVASISVFLDHAAGLEGFRDSSEAMDHSQWKNLPYWMNSLWLPIEHSSVLPVVLEANAETLFAGTASGLISDLEGIKAKSPERLGVAPPFFDLMVARRREFHQINIHLDKTETLQWVWLAFRTAADMAVKENVMMSWGG